MSVTRELSEAVVNVGIDDVPKEAQQIATQICLDGIGVIAAGLREPSGIGRITVEYVKRLGGAPQSTVIGGGFKTSATSAAYANGTLCHALDFDNTMWPSNHPTSPTLPAILAVAERDDLSGKDVLLAIVTAFEVQARIRVASSGVKPGIPGSFHKPGVSGTMGATASVGKLIGLDADLMCMAFGIAGSRCGGLTVNTGTMTKSTHSGNAARMGVEAATLASMGYTAHDDIFGKGLFFESLWGPGNYDLPLLLENFGDPYYVIDPGVGFKKHPSNYFTHRPIDAAISLREERRLDAREIERVEIDFPRFPYVDRPNPSTGLEGKFSVQYTTLVALLDGVVSMESFSDVRRFAADIEMLLPRTALIFSDAIPSDFNDTWATVRVVLQTGEVLTKRCDKPRGIWGVPLTRDERLAKFRMCMEAAYSRRRIEEVISMVEDLSSLPRIGVLLEALMSTER
jgi:aconitate decarboxylase